MQITISYDPDLHSNLTSSEKPSWPVTIKQPPKILYHESFFHNSPFFQLFKVLLSDFFFPIYDLSSSKRVYTPSDPELCQTLSLLPQFPRHSTDAQSVFGELGTFIGFLGTRETLPKAPFGSSAFKRVLSITFFMVLRTIRKYTLEPILHSIKKYLLCQAFCYTKKNETADSLCRGKE